MQSPARPALRRGRAQPSPGPVGTRAPTSCSRDRDVYEFAPSEAQVKRLWERSHRVAGLPITTHVSTDAQTQAMPRVSAAVIAAPDAEIPTPTPGAETTAPGRDTEIAAPQPAAENAASAPGAEVAAAGSDAEGAGEVPVQQVYEAAMARLNALHDSWAAAMVELREAQVDSGLGKAAA
jgi:hypothetical protein